MVRHDLQPPSGAPARALAVLLVLAWPAGFIVIAQEPDQKPPADAEESAEYWWEGDPTPWGMVTLSGLYANDSDGPSSHGFRAAYGACGIGDESYGWAEFWLAYREGGDQKITSAGLSLVPLSLLYRRVGLGFLLDVGLERREYPDRYVVAGIVGGGVEFVVRLFRRWDFATTAEVDYQTTVAAESQVRFAIRFHHEKLRGPWND